MRDFLEKSLFHRFCIAGFIAIALSCICGYLLLMVSPLFVGIPKTEILQYIGLDFSSAKAITGYKYLLSIQTICLFFIPGLVFIQCINGSIGKTTGITSYTKKDIVLYLSIMGIIICDIPGINLLSEINCKAALSVLGEDSEAWQNYCFLEDAMTKLLDHGSLISNILCFALIPAISEELFFRGFLQNFAIKKMRTCHHAIVFVAIIFSICHLDVFNCIPRLVLGLILGYIFYYTKDLVFSIIAHATHNAMVVVLNAIDGLPAEAETFGATGYSIIAGFASLLLLTAYTVSLRKIQRI